MFIFDDEYLYSISSLVKCPSALLYMLLIVSVCALRNYIFDVMRKLVITSTRRRFEFYSDVEDKLFLEEFEDPN